MCTTIMDLGFKSPSPLLSSPLGFLGLNSIRVVYVDPLGKLKPPKVGRLMPQHIQGPFFCKGLGIRVGFRAEGLEWCSAGPGMQGLTYGRIALGIYASRLFSKGETPKPQTPNPKPLNP